MNECIIRKATNEDISALRALYLALEKDGVRYQPEHFVIGERTNEFFQSVFNGDNQDILVADINGETVGFAHVLILQQKKVSCLKPQSVIYIQDLCVREDKRNNGIGSKLIRATKDYGKERNADFIRTQVFPKNVDGMRFYERNGFCEMGMVCRSDENRKSVFGRAASPLQLQHSGDLRCRRAGIRAAAEKIARKNPCPD